MNGAFSEVDSRYESHRARYLIALNTRHESRYEEGTSNYTSLSQNIASFIGLFCKRDLPFQGLDMTRAFRIERDTRYQ